MTTDQSSRLLYGNYQNQHHQAHINTNTDYFTGRMENVEFDMTTNAQKGDHKHINSLEIDYKFISIDKLLDDFEKDIETWSES